MLALSPGWQAGARVVRSAPWTGLLSVSLAAALLLSVGARLTGLVPIIVFLGLSTCGGAAAYALDEEAAPVADASPTSRGRRVAWRSVLLVPPLVVGIAGLFNLDRQDPSTHWWRLLPMVAGVLAVGVMVAAVLRRRGSATPGDVAAPVTAFGVTLICAVDPLRRWVSLAPIGSNAHLGRSVTLWTVITVFCAVTTVVCSRDPVRMNALRMNALRTHARGRHP